MNLAPVLIFVYNRPSHTQDTIESLKQNAEAAQSDLYIFSDGPKSKADYEAVQSVREQIASVNGFRSVTIKNRIGNFGLAKSIIAGVSEIIETHDRVIVLEDDIVVNPFFLRYMNSGLEQYIANERVASLHGWNFPLPNKNLPDTFFLCGADCWGWATWKRAWHFFEPDGSKLLQQLEQRGLSNRFDLDGAYPYTQMLRDQIAGRNNSWAIRWHASMFLLNKLTLHPGQSLVQNIGLDGSGVHAQPDSSLKTILSTKMSLQFPPDVSENAQMRSMIIKYLQKVRSRSFVSSFLRRLRQLMRLSLEIFRSR